MWNISTTFLNSIITHFYQALQITTILSFFIAKITNKTHWRLSIFIHKSSVSDLFMALSFLFSRSLIVTRITPSSLSIGSLFTSIFLRAHSIQSISSCRSWLNLMLWAGWICFFLLSIFACRNSFNLFVSSARREG